MAGVAEQIDGKLELSKVGSEFAFMQKKEDLKLRVHYLVRWKWSLTGPSSNILSNFMISGSLLTGGVSSGGSFYGNGAARQPIVETRPFFGSGEAGHINILHSFSTLTGTLANAKVSISGSAWPMGLEIQEELEYDGSLASPKFFWRSDINDVTGFNLLQKETELVVAGNILDRDNHHVSIALPLTNGGSGILIKADDFEIITLPLTP